MRFEQLFDLMETEITQRGNSDVLNEDVIGGIKDSCIFILGKSHELVYFRNQNKLFSDICTIGRKGFGEEKNSEQSPRGLHDIGGIVGLNGHQYQGIKHKQLSGKTLLPSSYGTIEPGIISRVLILNGLEQNFNGNSYERSIYIHGSRQEWFWEDLNTKGVSNLKRSLGCFGLRPGKIAELTDTHLSKAIGKSYLYVLENN